MRAVIQRVKSASVSVDSKVVSSISKGLLVLIGIGQNDCIDDAQKIANKILKLRLWPEINGDETKPWKKNVVEIDGDILCVSQFTLLANIKKGAKPDFHAAAKGDNARMLYNTVLELIRKGLNPGKVVKDGVFGAMMDVALVNDGPVTIQVDTATP